MNAKTGSDGVNYKRSPFYDTVERVTEQLTLPSKLGLFYHRGTVLSRKAGLEQHRQQLQLPLVLNQQQVDRLQNDRSLRLMLFCAGEPIMGGSLVGADVTFPHQLEVKVNGEEVKANFKGLKNKPGSTRPADITGFCRTKVPNYQNQISVMYALTSKKFYIQVILVKKHSVMELTERIKRAHVISKQRVINESTSQTRLTIREEA